MWNGGAWRRKSDCRHSEKKLVCWIFTHGTTEQAYLNLFSFMNYTWLSSPSYTPRVKNILNDNLLISCQMGKIHSFLQICSWFFINIFNDFSGNAFGLPLTFQEEICKSVWSHFSLQHITNLHMWLRKQRKRVCLGSFCRIYIVVGFSPLTCLDQQVRLMQVFACRRILLIREQTRQWKPICRYFQVKLSKRQDYGMIHTVSITRKFSSLD